MTMNEFSPIPTASELEPYHQMKFRVIPRAVLLEGGNLTPLHGAYSNMYPQFDQMVVFLKQFDNKQPDSINSSNDTGAKIYRILVFLWTTLVVWLGNNGFTNILLKACT